jgi:pyruvate formate lyase activating enzyme
VNIAAIEKLSLLDFPNVVSALVFTQGCNYDCFYCHNRSLLEIKKTNQYEESLNFLKKREGKLQGVVITGGEPTIQRRLKEFIIACKNLNYLVKLDTNGSNPRVLDELIKDNLLDYIALDVKATVEDYQKVCGSSANYKSVIKTLNLLKESSLKWEVRTTLYPNLTTSQLDCIKKEIGEIPLWRFNLYREPLHYKKDDQLRIKSKALTKEEIQNYLENYQGRFVISN